MKVIFFGTPAFAASVLEFLIENQVDIAAVVSKPDRPKGRSGTPVFTPVKETLLSKAPHLPIFQPELVSTETFAQSLASFQADLFVVVAYGEIIKPFLLELPRIACINLHASLLPKYRGAAPIQKCLIDGEEKSGVTIMHMVKKMDAGDMIRQVTVDIPEEMTYGELEAELCRVGKMALLETIRSFERGEVLATPQDPAQVTFAPKIELEDCQIDWNRPAKALHNLIRGVNPHPGAWCFVEVRGEKKRLKINRTRFKAISGFSPGTILNPEETKTNLIVAAQDASLELLEVQLEGKKRMSSEEMCRAISRSSIRFL